MTATCRHGDRLCQHNRCRSICAACILSEPCPRCDTGRCYWIQVHRIWQCSECEYGARPEAFAAACDRALG